MLQYGGEARGSDSQAAAAVRAWRREGGDEDVLRFYVHGESLGATTAVDVCGDDEAVGGVLGTRGAVQYVDGTRVLRMTGAQAQMALGALVATRRVEVWTGDAGRFSLHVRASPGNVEALEPILGESAPVPAIVACFYPGAEGSVGAAFADATRMRVGWAQLTDASADTDAFLVQTGAREVVLPRGRGTEALRAVCAAAGLVVNEREPKDFCPIGVRGDGSLPKAAGASVGALVRHLGGDATWTLDDETVLGAAVRLDDAALRALDVFGTRRGPGSLHGLLDRCETRAGSRTLASWLRRPLRDMQRLRARHDAVAHLAADAGLRASLRSGVLRGLCDVGRVARRLLGPSAGLKDVVVLRDAAGRTAALVSLLGIDEESGDLALSPDGAALDSSIGSFGSELSSVSPRLSSASQSLAPGALGEIGRGVAQAGRKLGGLAALVDAAVDADALARHEYLVRPEVDAVLGALAAQRAAVRAEMEDEAQRVASLLRLDARAVRVEHSAVHGHCMRVTRSDGRALAECGDALSELAATRSGVLFTSGALRALAERDAAIAREYGAAQAAAVTEVVSVARTYWRPLDALGDALASLDALLALATAAADAPVPYARPEMAGGDAALVLSEMRHPCVEAAGGPFVANTLVLGGPSGRLAVVTGPNMGGKSTYIRAAALCVLLAHAGGLVPASAARIPLVDAILVRVGAGDSLVAGRSTFMVEMAETAAVLRMATRDSLVVVDELGRGTSTAEGLGIARAVALELASRGCLSLFATHFHELISLADLHPSIFNLHAVAAVDESGDAGNSSHASICGTGGVRMTYQIAPGGCSASYGLEVARMAGFPPAIVDVARVFLADASGEPGRLGAALADEDACDALEAYLDGRGALPSFVAALCPSLVQR